MQIMNINGTRNVTCSFKCILHFKSRRKKIKADKGRRNDMQKSLYKRLIRLFP